MPVGPGSSTGSSPIAPGSSIGIPVAGSIDAGSTACRPRFLARFACQFPAFPNRYDAEFDDGDIRVRSICQQIDPSVAATGDAH